MVEQIDATAEHNDHDSLIERYLEARGKSRDLYMGDYQEYNLASAQEHEAWKKIVESVAAKIIAAESAQERADIIETDAHVIVSRTSTREDYWPHRAIFLGSVVIATAELASRQNS